MTFSAKVIAHSRHALTAKDVITLQLSYPRFIHAEFMTHRVFSRNASSSRAIPVAKMIEQVRTNPAKPIHWGANQPGMQAATELAGESLECVKFGWEQAAHCAADLAEAMSKAGCHKQVANRILEPFQWMHVIVTATEWGNFFELRDHEDAQPEIRYLAQLMHKAISESTPKILNVNEWHLPYVTADDLLAIEVELGTFPNKDRVLDHARKVSAARCCRVSYLKHDGSEATFQEEFDLCDRLAGAHPIHASPFEHQATPDYWSDAIGYYNEKLSGNFVGWIQHRKQIELSF